ncbi:HD-GYP domain-containing protein [Paenibacillus cremeus]|uniref:HD domain-containing protein n=1 Tax=Paenibacillus cremeus TaxID=2163881 RepID=A0A559KDT4_9BACL|nr:HD domain-containing phosphohydrolase [Paenibacillus cremeus]TVY10273.1 HD domain-containing protein [Paenibacillus cremeus]
MQYNNYDDLIGKRLLNNVLDARGVMLIPEDTILLRSHVEKLENFNIDIFDLHVEPVKDEQPVPDIPDAPPSEVKNTKVAFVPVPTQELVKRSEKKMQEIHDFVHKNGKLPVAEIEDQILPYILEVSQQRNIYQLFSELKSTGDFRYKQSVGVAVIATMLGKWLQLDNQELSLLTTAASLYDIGSIKLPHFLLQKTTWYQPHEMEIMRSHTRLGYELINESGLDQRVALVALQHHEREDGSGYPNQLRGPQIDRLSKIVALADVYLAMISERPYRPANPFYHVIQELQANILNHKFDPIIGMTFLNRLMSSQVGSEVILSDERKGKILMINANYPTSPLVALDSEGFIDLSKLNSVKIRDIVG